MKKYRAYAWISFIATLLLALMLAGFLYLWTAFSVATMMNQLGLQRARVERLTKSAVILADHPTDEQRAQAINEIQVILPVWQQTEVALQAGDPTLSLPRRVPTDIQALLFQATPDYTAITTAAKLIVASPDKIDPDQIMIIQQHENSYYLTINQINLVWVGHLNDAAVQIFVIELAILGLIVLAIVLQQFLLVRRLLKEVNSAPDLDDKSL